MQQHYVKFWMCTIFQKTKLHVLSVALKYIERLYQRCLNAKGTVSTKSVINFIKLFYE